jgi:8-oxo-dGTP pyrophosphatase MutT (NUDIX family)/nucleoside 2-deoxyribosyltransferase
MVRTVYYDEPLPREQFIAFFLAGPTPRTKDVASWRPQALEYITEIAKEKNIDVHVFIPEYRNSRSRRISLEDMVEWDKRALNRADMIIFWLPRNLETFPGYTTNIEWGWWFRSGKVVFGAPDYAEKVDYVKIKAREENVSIFDTLYETIMGAFAYVGYGVARTGGECDVPLYIWRTPEFQSWYKDLKAAGNTLEAATVEWVFPRARNDRSIPFLWVLHVHIYIANERRYKDNEVVIARPDIAAICLYKPGKTLLDTTIILIREFRSPVSSSEGFVWEIPSGSHDFNPNINDKRFASKELEEETGLVIDPTRIKFVGGRQVASTLLSHKANLFAVKITEDELLAIRGQEGSVHGIAEDTERTYLEIRTLGEILKENLVDWSMLGMILSVVAQSQEANDA